MSENAVYTAYKPLRNTLRQLDLRDSLHAIWAYADRLQFRTDFPPGINVDCSFKYAKTDSEKYQFIAPWDLEILTHEVMVCCSNVVAATGKSLRHWATMAKVVNQVKSIDGVIAENLIKQDNRFSALERSMYKQFPWQTRSEFYDIVKYYKIYSDPILIAASLPEIVRR